jgi:hypothetical protein
MTMERQRRCPHCGHVIAAGDYFRHPVCPVCRDVP